jgi:hypothetical protein
MQAADFLSQRVLRALALRSTAAAVRPGLAHAGRGDQRVARGGCLQHKLVHVNLLQGDGPKQTARVLAQPGP